MDFSRERQKLLAALGRGLSESEFSAGYRDLLDRLIVGLFQAEIEARGRMPGVALIALGGYGYGEMAPFSDVDLLCLHDPTLSEQKVAPVFEAVLYPLWDHKLDVGHGSRTIGQCQALAGSDFVSLVSMLEGRFLAGDTALFAALVQERKRWLSTRSRRLAFFKNLKKSLAERSQKYGQSPYLLEPNVKEGQGGLRDIQAIYWTGLGLYDLPTFGGLAKAGLVPRNADRTLTAAHAFMLRVRFQLHVLAKVKTEILTFDLQAGLARVCGYQDEGHISAVERFMQEYYTHVYAVRAALDFFVSRVEEDLRPPRLRRLTQGARTVEKGLIVRRGLVELTSTSEVRQRPGLMMRAFDVAMNEGLEISQRALDIIHSNLDLVDDAFRRNPKVARSFLSAITATPPDATSAPANLEAMQGIRFLAAYLPELAPIQARVQYDAYHVYTVDVHLVLTLWELKKIAAARSSKEGLDFERSILEQVHSPEVLYLAAFLHDVGKDVGRDHARRGAKMMPGICERLGLSPEQTEDAAFLVAEHVFLVETATRRDLTEEKLIFTCAQKIGTADRLNMLFLLTVADSRATGPGAWNPWRETLLRDLYTKTFHVLTRSDLAGKEAAGRREALGREVEVLLAGKMAPARVKQLLETTSAHYLSVMTALEVARHFLLEERLGAQVLVLEVRDTGEGYYEVTLVTRDRPGLLASMAGVFTLNSINILGAQVFTRTSGIAIDVFQVDPPPDTVFINEAWAKVREDADRVLSGRQPHDFRLSTRTPVFRRGHGVPRRPSRVVIDNEVSDFYTVVEVYTHDRLGLLYDLTQTLFTQDLSIDIAKISTKVDQVVDVFYVRDFEGQKVDDPDRVKALNKALTEALT